MKNMKMKNDQIAKIWRARTQDKTTGEPVGALRSRAPASTIRGKSGGQTSSLGSAGRTKSHGRISSRAGEKQKTITNL